MRVAALQLLDGSVDGADLRKIIDLESKSSAIRFSGDPDCRFNVLRWLKQRPK
jgi:hypothetical protein